MASKIQNTKNKLKKLLVFTENILKQYENATDTTIISHFKHNAGLFNDFFSNQY